MKTAYNEEDATEGAKEGVKDSVLDQWANADIFVLRIFLSNAETCVLRI